MQRAFMGFMNPFVFMMKKTNEKTRRYMVIIAFIGIFLVFCTVRIVRINAWHVYYMAVGILLLIWITIWSTERKMRILAYNKPLVLTWYALCLAMILSEIWVPKRYFGIGGTLFILFPLLFYVWNNYSKPEVLREAFAISIRITFILSTVYGFLFRPHTEGMRYAGFLINPNMYGMYLVTTFCVYIAYLDKQIETKQRIATCLPYYIELGINCFLMYMTQSRTALLSAVFMFASWLFLRLHIDYSQPKKKSFIRRTGLVFLIIGCMFPISDQALRIVPQWVNHPIQYEKDRLFAHHSDFYYTVNAAETTDAPGGEDPNARFGSRIIQSITDPENSDISTGRFAIYRSYFNQLNWKGHRGIAKKVEGVHVAHAHNNFLQFAFTYGIMAGILFILLELAGIFYAIRYFNANRSKGYLAFLPLAIISSFFVMTLTECVFLPFHAFPAFAFWFVVGWLFPKEG